MNHFFHVIKDPVHGTMQFTDQEDHWIKPFIDNPLFQRLRFIRQMGMGDFIFPGAVHTRFSHSIGCCYVASQIAHKIRLSDAERQLVMIACLLHDIGHGPFSHTFEGIFADKLVRHEDWTPYFLNDFRQTGFFEQYNQRNPSFPLKEDNFEIIANMIMHYPVDNHVLADIVSSQLDADRLDYLLRDGHFCGVQYGTFDLRWMLHCLMIVETKTGKRLGINHKGIGAVEHYLMARRLMIRNIYQLQKKLAFEHFFIQCVAELAITLSEEKAYAEIKKTRIGQFLIAMNDFNQVVASRPDMIQTNKEAFLKNNYHLYKELCDHDVFFVIKELSEMDSNQKAVQLAKRLAHRRMPSILRIDQASLPRIEAELAHFQAMHQETIQPWQLAIIQTPHQSYSGENDPIWVVNEHGRVKPISDYSLMLNALSDKLEHSSFVCVDHALMTDPSVLLFIEKLKELMD